MNIKKSKIMIEESGSQPQTSSENKAFGIRLIPFDDGQKPGGTNVDTKLALYENKHQSNFFMIFDHLLPEEWCSRAYEYAIEKGSPWGAYITTEEALSPQVDLEAEKLWKEGKCEKAIALRAVRALIIERGGSMIGKDLSIIHGTAVWSLSSGAKDEVRYHIDYGELYRYETNVIYPPVYAGTCQVSPIFSQQEMDGGAFRANIDGIQHYQRFGYKCRLSTPSDFEKDLSSSKWITVPYCYNRGILHDGNYPHYSTEIRSIQPSLKRVILGFNCFTKELAECNLRAPEHSDAFNRTIKLYQKMAAMGLPITNAPLEEDDKYSSTSSPTTRIETKPAAVNPKKGVNLEDIKKNPALAKLLIKAAKTLKETNKKAQR